ncbi:unnamed protein product, partial [Tenebrio molitor]
NKTALLLITKGIKERTKLLILSSAPKPINMKSLFVLLLLIVVVSVVRGTTKCYFCGRNCDEDHVVEATCQ